MRKSAADQLKKIYMEKILNKSRICLMDHIPASPILESGARSISLQATPNFQLKSSPLKKAVSKPDSFTETKMLKKSDDIFSAEVSVVPVSGAGFKSWLDSKPFTLCLVFSAC